MYEDTVATGEYAWAPSITHLQDEDINENIAVGDDSESDENENFVESLDAIFPETTAGGSASRKDKKKKNFTSGLQVNKDNKINKGRRLSGGSIMLSNQIEKLVSTVEKKGNIAELPKSSITDVMVDMQSFLDMDTYGDLYMFTTELFEQKSKREIYSLLKNSDEKLKWLQYHFNKNSK